MPAPYPPLAPYAEGMLDVGDGNRMYWATFGNPAGKPAAFVHGGPGGGTPAGPRRAFDPERYRIVLFDQRGCGRSTPHASDPATDMTVNTTDRLVEDMERLRGHLGIDRWLLFGGSWGTTLALAYAERYPRRVSELVLASVTTSRRREIDWLYRGAGRLFPGAWRAFRDAAAPAGDGELLAAYARLVADRDPAVRLAAASAWAAWEDAVLSLEPNGRPGRFGDRPDADLVAMVRICAHIYGHAAWLEEGALIASAHRLAGIPGVLIHGRHDLSCPLETAWDLHRAWPGSRLAVIDDAGHRGSPASNVALYEALEAFART